MTGTERRVLVFLRRKAGLSREQFLRHWGDVHGPLVASQPAFWKYTSRYLQNHLAAAAEAPFDGIAASTQLDPAVEAGIFPDEPCYLAVIRPDEERFLDFTSIVRMRATVGIIRDGPPLRTKLIALLDCDQLAAFEAAQRDLPATIERIVVNRVESVAGTPPEGFMPEAIAAVIELWAFERAVLPALDATMPYLIVEERLMEQPAA